MTFSLYWMLAGLTLAVVGLQYFYLGCIAQMLYDYTGAARHVGSACSRTRGPWR